jgi:DNA polymerase, archaea type
MNKLLNGKNDLKNIVSIEIINDKAEIFLQTESGETEVTFADNEYWILSNTWHDDNWSKLKGDLHYKYGKKYNQAGEFYKAKAQLRAKDADIFSITDPKEAFMVRNGYTYHKDLHPKDITILSFDIETTGLYHNDDSKVLIISNTFRKNGITIRKLFTYDEYENDGEMINDWCNWIQEMDPSIICGHNIYSYDLPYLHFVASRYANDLKLGRNGSPVNFFNYQSMKRIDGSREQAYNKVRIYGREVIDTMFLAINYDVGKKYESYALKKIIAQEGLEVDNRQFYAADTIRFNYTDVREWEKIKAYAIHDADDSLALFDLMSPAFFYLAQNVPKSFQSIVESASGAQINSMMVRSYVQEGHSIPKASPVNKFIGAISLGNPGIYRNAFKVDVASLYPSIMIYHKVYDKLKDPKGNMLEMIQTFTNERLKNKKLAKETGIKYYDDMQNAQKIMINSFYGFLAANGLAFNSPENAAFVTEAGREVLSLALQWAENKAFKIVNADTDSITFCYPDYNDMSLEHRKELLVDLNNLYPERIHFEDDGYYKTIIVLMAKNYILYDGKKIKTKGSALKDAKKEIALKEFLFSVIETIINGKDNYSEIYNKYITEALNIQDIKRWCSKKTISSKVLKNERTNEAKIRDAIKDAGYSEGDKAFVYYKPDGSLGLVEKFDGVYDKEKMLEKVHKTALTFENIIDKSIFPNYKLKKNKGILNAIANG